MTILKLLCLKTRGNKKSSDKHLKDTRSRSSSISNLSSSRDGDARLEIDTSSKDIISKRKKIIYWFNTREEPVIYIHDKPYVLRDAESPKRNIKTYSGIRSERLEMMEERLKEDLIREAKENGGLILVYDELQDGTIVPSFIGIDDLGESVSTPKEIFNALSQKLAQDYPEVSSSVSLPVSYHRIPISPEQRPEDKYLDEFVDIIKNSDIDDLLVFNCGLGVGRTTFSMISALLIRRAQVLIKNNSDPYGLDSSTQMVMSAPLIGEGSSLSGTTGLITRLDNEMERMAMLRLVYVLERGLESKMSPQSAIEWMLQRSSRVDDLKNAILGNYQVIMKLSSVLEQGTEDKRLLDLLVNRCDHLVNIREEILINRAKYSVHGDKSYLGKALVFLERYFFLLAFSSYIHENIVKKSNFELPFSSWLGNRSEIVNMLDQFRDSKEADSFVLFRPIQDLSSLVEPKLESIVTQRTLHRDLDKSVIKNRSGTVLTAETILKADYWPHETSALKRRLTTEEKLPKIKGALNFRKIPKNMIFGSAQPSSIGIENVINYIESLSPSSLPLKIIWVNLREEPLIYIHGAPYVLRDEYFNLRNIKSYSGITQSRLELLECRLKEDIVKEIQYYDGRLLLHEESQEALVEPVWTLVDPENVITMAEIMAKNRQRLSAARFEYFRVPITAEAFPEIKDFDQIFKILKHFGAQNIAIVMNCQIGMGRSTTGTIVASLILRSMQSNALENAETLNKSSQNTAQYEIIHSLLRVIRNGLECKKIVDNAVDNCSTFVNIRDVIEQWRAKAENSIKEEEHNRATQRALRCLHRYFLLICFQAFLEDQKVSKENKRNTNFRSWMEAHPEFDTMLRDMEVQGEKALLPVGEKLPGDGKALSSEVEDVVQKRSGAVLAKFMILKFDHFPGCQKLDLKERIDGAPNYRRVFVDDLMRSIGLTTLSFTAEKLANRSIFGIAMPKAAAIKKVLERAEAYPGGPKHLFWTSLREEPVIYIKDNPFVLRTFNEPVKNLETTGIEKERVEMMEVNMKRDVLSELKRYGGRVLLHEEEEFDSGFQIVPVWETVSESEVLTPSEVFQKLISEGYRVDYLRIPITDEQAPIPQVFDLIMNRVEAMGPSTDIMFNCQMGRGRTTTGMVIACLFEMIRYDVLQEPSGILTPPINAHQASFFDEGPVFSGDEEDEKNRYLKGEFKIVLQLLRVLQFGKLSKRLVDKSIDACEHIQNIRRAIYDYKLRVEAKGKDSPDYEKLFQVAYNYLIRYFYLIVFASYVVERETYLKTPNNKVGFPLFSHWLEDRREITNILAQSSLEIA